MDKRILIIAGPSAVGKTTLATALFEADPRFEFVRSVTTRAPRGDSFDDEYIYVTHEEFLHLIETSGVLEHTEYAGNLYGTPRSEIDRITAEGRIPLLVLDVNGVRSLSINKGDIKPCGVYVYDELDTLKDRLINRYCGDESRAASRIRQNSVDFAHFSEYYEYFYGFVRNGETVDIGAERVAQSFRDFCNDLPKMCDEEDMKSVGICI